MWPSTDLETMIWLILKHDCNSQYCLLLFLRQQKWQYSFFLFLLWPKIVGAFLESPHLGSANKLQYNLLSTLKMYIPVDPFYNI